MNRFRIECITPWEDDIYYVILERDAPLQRSNILASCDTFERAQWLLDVLEEYHE